MPQGKCEVCGKIFERYSWRSKSKQCGDCRWNRVKRRITIGGEKNGRGEKAKA